MPTPRSTMLSIALFITAACGGGAAGTTPITDSPTTTTTPTTTEAPVAHQVVEDVPYTAEDTLDVWVPDAASDAPMVVILHGHAGSRDGYSPIAETLVGAGAVVLNASWSAAVPTREGAAGAACTVRFARAKASEFGGDPEQIVIVGHSAGGAIAAAIALAGDDFSEADCLTPGFSALPAAFVGLAGSYDPADAPLDARRGLEVSDPELYSLLNPMTHIGEHATVRVRLVHGDMDDVIPVQSAERFDEALTGGGYDVTLKVLEGVGHNSLVAPSFPAFAVTIEEILAAAGLGS